MKKQLLLSALTLALLSACGGSDDNGNTASGGISPADSTTPSTQGNNNSSNNNQTAQKSGNDNNSQRPGSNTNNNGQQPATPANNGATAITARNEAFTGYLINAPKQRGGLEPKATDNNDNLHLGDIKLPTFAADAHQGGVLSFNNTKGKDGLSYNSFKVSDNSYRHVQFGFVEHADTYDAFIRHDKTTVQLPTQGTANYRGDSIMNIHDTSRAYQRTEIGTVAATADFAAKQLSITLQSPSHQKSISGIPIAGDASFVKEQGPSYTSISGNFAGANGEELTGLYIDSASDNSLVTGTFGAKRQ